MTSTDVSVTGSRFPSPFEVPTPPGAEGWQRMYSWYLQFSQENREFEDSVLWFQDGMHHPEVEFPFDTITHECWRLALGQYNSRVFAVPPAYGIEQRILNGYLYITPIPVTDEQWMGERVAAFTRRAGYYYQNWDRLYEGWKARIADLIGQIEAVRVPPLDEFEDPRVVTESTGVAQNHYVRENFHRCIDLFSKMWHHHTEFLMLGYGAYVVFFEFCKSAFPEISEQTVARMVAGIDVIMYRPDDELKRLARLAVESGLADEFPEGCDPDAVLTRLAERGEAGREWLAAFDAARHPWFHVSTGDGFYHHHLSWNENLAVPFAALTRYVRQVSAGETLERPTSKLLAERDRIAAEYRALLATEEDRGAFDQMLGVCRLVFPYVEDHKFYCEHWFTTRFFQKIRAFGELLVGRGVLEEAEDVFHLQHYEIDQALADVMLAWASGGEPLGAAHLRPIIAERKWMLEVLRSWSPPPALGPVPEALNDPAVQMLWGITQDTIESWYSQAGSGNEREVRGYAASSGIVEGTARVLRDVNEIGQIRDGEILVCPVTAPSWGPVFGKIKAAVSDIGGTMSHAAIVAREYGMPAVVGTGQATARIRTGHRVRVDGDRGVVTILD